MTWLVKGGDVFSKKIPLQKNKFLWENSFPLYKNKIWLHSHDYANYRFLKEAIQTLTRIYLFYLFSGKEATSKSSEWFSFLQSFDLVHMVFKIKTEFTLIRSMGK